MSNLARLLTDTDRASEAAPLFSRAIAIGEKTLGRDHPQTQRYASHYSRLLLARLGGFNHRASRAHDP